MKQTELGRKWIEIRLHDLAARLHLEIEKIEWCTDRSDLQKNRTTLAFVVEKIRYTIRLDNADIQGSPTAAGIREYIDRTIEHILRTIKDRSS